MSIEPPMDSASSPQRLTRELAKVEREMARLRDRRSLVLTMIALWQELARG